MHWFKVFVASVIGLAATLATAVICLIVGLVAFLRWRVTCGPYDSWAEGCNQSENIWLELGFVTTAAVLGAGALMLIALVVRLLARWVSPERETEPLGWHAAATAVLVVTAIVLVAVASPIREAL